jgi:protein TonB
MTPRILPLAVALAALAAACSKSEPPPAKTAPAAPIAKSARTPAAPAGEIDPGVKDRLARQEAAARMFEKNVLQPPPPKVPEPPAMAKPETPARATPAPPSAAAAPPRTEAPRAEAAKTEAPKVEPPKPEVAKAPVVAAAAPAPAPAATSAPRLVSRVDPEFPREAVQGGVDQGSVKARMTLDAPGNVVRVEILDATPRRVFDRAVIRALSQWRYSEGAAGRTVDMEVAFKR